MSDLPEHILIVVCRHSKCDESILKILKEYFNSLPRMYISKPLDSRDDYYILPYTKTFREIVDSIAGKLHYDILDGFGFAIYDQSLNYANVYGKDFEKEFYNSRFMPLFIKINYKDIEKLKSLTWD